MNNPKLDEVHSWLIKARQVWAFILAHLPGEAHTPWSS